MKIFLHARDRYLCHPSKQSPHFQSNNDDEIHEERLKATSVILLFDPNHITAANFRKRHLLRNGGDTEAKLRSLHIELSFLTSLLTSPLTKHTKSSTLWSYRIWIYRTHLDLLLRASSPVDKPETLEYVRKPRTTIWKEELSIVLKAGERHPRNYYAWEYARHIFRIFGTFEEGSRDVVSQRNNQIILVETLKTVHQWCLMHPRDISGWSFLVFLLVELRDEVCRGRGAESGMEGEGRRVVWETREWVRKYEWRGESVGWFLTAAKELKFG